MANRPPVPPGLAAARSPLVVVGAVAVVAGGLVAAVTDPLHLEKGSWLAAYLVLVVGVAQVGLGGARALLSPAPTSWGRRVAEVVLFNGGSALVVVCSLAQVPAVVTGGGVALLVALASLAAAPRGAGRGWVTAAYLGLLVVLAASVPVGVVLAWVRA